jgi:hypothetical protein
MAAPTRIAYTSIVRDELETAYVTNLRHASRTERPEAVDIDVWERYENGRPWVLLNVGIMGLLLDRADAGGSFERASRLLYERQSNYWLVPELLAARGSLRGETAFGQGLSSIVSETVEATVARTRGLRFERANGDEHPQLRAEAVTLLFCAIARNDSERRRSRRSYDFEGGDEPPADQLLRSVRSSDRATDRRLANLRAIAGRRFSDKNNLASLRSLIWGAIGASTITQAERDTGYALMGVEPLLDPVTLAAAMLILEEGGLRDRALSAQGELQTAPTRSTPRGWDNDVDLESGRDAFRQYLDVLRTHPPNDSLHRTRR